jgi:hypothetical protein
LVAVSTIITMRAQAQGLHDPADPTLPDKLAGHNGASDLEALREGDRPEAARRRDRLLQVVQLIERDTAGLVGHDVLAVAQRGHRDCGTAVGHSGRDNHINRRIAQQGLRVVRPLHVGPAFDNLPRNRCGLVVREDAHQLATLAQ